MTECVKVARHEKAGFNSTMEDEKAKFNNEYISV